jgi:hypothetical protein
MLNLKARILLSQNASTWGRGVGEDGKDGKHVTSHVPLLLSLSYEVVINWNRLVLGSLNTTESQR